MHCESTDSNAAIPVRSTRCRVLGVGSAGLRVLEALRATGLPDTDLIALNTDAEGLAACGVPDRIQLGIRLTRGLGAGGDPEVGRTAAEEVSGVLRDACAGAALVFVVTGLGGGTGTGAAPVVARLARESGALVVGLVTMPFECEGARRQRQARRGLNELKSAADVVLCLPCQRALSLVDEHTSLVETFRQVQGLLVQGLQGVWRLATQPGLISLDFADLSDLVRHRHAESYFACTEACGAQRAKEAVERLLLHPLLENGALLRQTGAGLVSLVAGPDLSMAEVSRVMDQLQRECDGAEILLGAAVDASLGDRLMLTFIGTRALEGMPAPEAGGVPGPAVAEAPAAPGEGLETDFFDRQPAARRPRSRFVAPPPELTPEQQQDVLAQGTVSRRGAKARMHQAMLPLEIVSKGRFEKSEPTLYRGEDLDVPTFVRRGITLN